MSTLQFYNVKPKQDLSKTIYFVDLILHFKTARCLYSEFVFYCTLDQSFLRKVRVNHPGFLYKKAVLRKLSKFKRKYLSILESFLINAIKKKVSL